MIDSRNDGSFQKQHSNVEKNASRRKQRNATSDPLAEEEEEIENSSQSKISGPSGQPG